MRKLLEKFQEQNKIYRYEGDRGIENFERVLQAIGYRPHGFRHGTTVEVFLADNPGAFEVLIEWIANSRVPEWKNALQEVVQTTENDDEDDEECGCDQKGGCFGGNCCLK